ncbi:EAL domain-containing protein [Idiomarina sp. A28L]|uniref:putative bifunctional diguanylate cyclase/phosphodiesterase n=1 Tax=Idiomarina sp. A28L TaxID=1036674 RepID=UPI000213887E|nr:GGDEF domain-containing phosphodiesterase [Idiomarina sp. A28L]EGN75730.1 EAL domain-containing protein [Idiomarina sp. A28L]
MSSKGVVQYYFAYRKRIQTYGGFAIIIAIALVTYLVWQTGGIKFVYSHSMYLPVLAAGLIFGLPGGVLFAALAGVALGPWMPIDTSTGELQEPVNWMYRTAYFVLIGGLSGLVNDSFIRYIEYLRWLGRHDLKTKLPNRKLLFEDIDALNSNGFRHRTRGNRCLLMVVSIDNVKQLQGAFGFRVIDQIIKVYSKLLQQHFGKTATLYRTDSNQIAVLKNSCAEDSYTAQKDVIVLLKSTVSFGSYAVYVSTHAGAITISSAHETPETYLQQAEIALAHAYATQQDCVRYSSAIELTAQRSITLLGDLQDALRAKHLTMHYQPKIDLKSNSVCGVEALIRWKHPMYGDIPPSDFIPQAEQSTLILQVTEYVISQVTQQIMDWKAQGVEVPVAINISSHDLMAKGFGAKLLAELERCEIAGKMIEIELTEGSLINDFTHTQIELLRLSKAKIIISVDDFGTGYSSLQYLHRLPISVIKIDRSFIRNLPNGNGGRYIVDAAVTLAKNMGIETLAEGVETPEANAYLRKIGCDSVQGFYYSEALPADKFVEWYRNYEPVAAH